MSEKIVDLIRAMDIVPWRRGHDSDWGGWKREGMELVYATYPHDGGYVVDLGGLTSSAEMLDTIMQVAGKSWATNDCVAGLVHALDYLLHPQATICCGGTNITLTAAQVRKRVKESGRSR